MSNNLWRINSKFNLPNCVNLFLNQNKDYKINEVNTSGRNSIVFILASKNKKYVLKKYYNKNNEGINRLTTEFKFLKYLEKVGIKSIPKAIELNGKSGYGFYSYINGKKVKKIQHNHIKQSANFIIAINEKYKLKNFKIAKEACFEYNDYIKNITIRIKKLQSEINKINDQVHIDALDFVSKKILPKFEDLKKNCINNFHKDQIILSPSDFGFHNILENNGNLFFIDFEYAGEDGITKLVADFICQPDIQITKSQVDYFIKILSSKFNINLFYLNNIILLTRLKWTCLILNVFHQRESSENFLFQEENKNFLEHKLNKAMIYFSKHLEIKI